MPQEKITSGLESIFTSARSVNFMLAISCLHEKSHWPSIKIYLCRGKAAMMGISTPTKETLSQNTAVVLSYAGWCPHGHRLGLFPGPHPSFPLTPVPFPQWFSKKCRRSSPFLFRACLSPVLSGTINPTMQHMEMTLANT